MYDPENWAATPVNEQQDPVKYMTLFGQLAHANGLKVIQAPALDLATVTGSVLPRQAGESADQWFVRVNIAGKASAAGDIFQLQDESNTTAGGQYSYMYNTTASQAQAANASVKVFSKVSTVNGTAAQMATAAQSISPDGYYVAAAGNIPQTDQFFQLMQTAGDQATAPAPRGPAGAGPRVWSALTPAASPRIGSRARPSGPGHSALPAAEPVANGSGKSPP